MIKYTVKKIGNMWVAFNSHKVSIAQSGVSESDVRELVETESDWWKSWANDLTENPKGFDWKKADK